MTKGNHAEQADKLARSGLAELLYRGRDCRGEGPAHLSPRHRSPELIAARSAWMIGNSPKSDINPALAAGLHAVFLFHKDTWVLEHATVDPAPAGQHLIELDSFAKLTTIF